jgi:hypothetical protein
VCVLSFGESYTHLLPLVRGTNPRPVILCLTNVGTFGRTQATLQEPGKAERLLPCVRHDAPLCRNVFEAFLGSGSCSPSTRAAAVAGAVQLLHRLPSGGETLKRDLGTLR